MTTAPASALARRYTWRALVAFLLVALLTGALPAARAAAEEVPPDDPPPEEPPPAPVPSTSPNWPLEMVSRGPGGVPGDAESFDASISADGAVVAFSSWATNLRPTSTPTANGGNVFARDLAAGTNELASVRPDGSRIAYPRHTTIDADGSTVVMTQDTNENRGLFLRDRANNAGGTIGQSSALNAPAVDAAGERVAYVQGDANPFDDDERHQAWIYGEGSITQLSTVAGLKDKAIRPAISGDGNTVAYEVQRDRAREVRVHDVTGLGTPLPAPVVVPGGQWPSISGNGRLLAYARYEAGPNAQFLRLLDRVTGEERVLAQLPVGVEPVELELSDDGSTLAYVANKWTDRNDPFPHEVWVTNVATGATEVVTDINCCGGDNDLDITADGRTLVVATDLGGLIPEDTNREFDVFVFRQVDGGGPTFPAGASLAVDDVSSSFVALRWPPATDDRGVTGYRLQRLPDGPVLELGPTATTATVTGLAPDTEYAFSLTAVDGDGHVSAPLTAHVRTEAPPTDPGTADLQVTSSGGTATLRWDEAQGDDVVGYRVLRATGEGELTPVAEVAAGTAEHVDRGLTAATTYRYRIAVIRDGGEAPHTVEATTTTGSPALSETSWTGRGRIGTALEVALGGAAGWQGQVEVKTQSWYGDGGELLPAPRPVTTVVPAAEDGAAPGTYRATFPINEGTAEVSTITGILSDGAATEARRSATRLPIAVLGSLHVEVAAPAGGIPGGRLVVSDVGQLALNGGATFDAPAVVPGTRTALVKSARGTDLGSETVDVHAGRHSSVTVTPRLPATSVVRVTKADHEPLGGSNVTFATVPGNHPAGTATSDSQGIARLDSELFAGTSLAVTVAPPGRLPYEGASRTITLAPGENLEHVALPAIPKGGLSGVVTLEDGTPAAAARVVLSQNIGGRTFGASTETGPDGRYSLDGLTGPGQVVVSYRQDPPFNAGAVTLGEAPTTFDVALPAPERYQIEVSLYSRTHEQSEYQGPMDIDYATAIHLDLRVYTKSGSKLLGTPQAVIDAQEGEEIKVCVDGDEAGMTSSCKTVTLGASRRLKVELRMESVAAVRGRMVDGAGRPVDPRLIQQATLFRLLPDGKTESIYAYRAHHGAFDIPVAAAGRYRLEASAYSGMSTYWGTATATVDFDVAVGEVVELGDLPLTTSSWAKRSSVTASRRVVPAGARIDLRSMVHLGRTGDVKGAVARITLPAGTSLVPGSLTLGGQPAEATVVNGALEVPLGDRRFITFDDLREAWVLRYQLSTDGVAPGDELTTTTFVRVPAENAGIAQLAGTLTLQVAAVTVDAPERTHTRTLELSGLAPAGTSVRLRDGTTHLGDTTTGPGGLWRLSTTLPDLGNGEDHELSASATFEGNELVSDPVRVHVDERLPVLEEVLMSRPNGTQVRIDPSAGVARFPYVYGGSQMDLSLRFGGRGAVENVAGQVGLYRGPGVQTGDRTYDVRLHTGHQSLGGVGVDYTALPEVIDLDDERKPTEDELRNRLPAPVSDYGQPVFEEEEDPATNTRRAAVTVRTPSLGPEATLRTSMSIQRGVDYTPTAADFEAVRKAGVQLYGGNFDYALGSDSLRVTMTGYMPEALLEQAPAARSLAATAIPLPPVRFVRVAFETNFTRAQTLDSLYTASQTGDKYERLNNLLNWVSNNCDPFHQAMYREQLEEMNKRALANDATHAGLMLAGVLLAPETLGIGTLAVWGTTFFLDKLADYFMDNAISKLVENVKGDCVERDDDPDRDDRNNPDHPVADPVWIHDPSGYVFEAVPSNRVEGATATLFGSATPDGQFTPWDADWYGQANPLTTDAEGRYGWDVPEGFWQVVATKDGHEAGRSAVLEVLPPHFDVNIPIVNPAAPEVAKVGAVSGDAPAVDVGFSRYMQLSVAADRRITVTDATGNPVDGTVEPVDAEDGPTGRFARTFRFVPGRSLVTGEALTVHVDELATSYAGSPLAGPFTTQVTVTDPPPPAAPTAANDEADLDEDTTAVVDVLANDVDSQGDALGAEVVTQPAHGTVTAAADGKVAFTPAPHWYGTDTFTYRASDGTSASEPATVTVTVRPVNDTPVADDDATAVDEDTFTSIDVLDGDTDADGNPLFVKELGQPAHGTTAIAADGTITYIPSGSWHGTDTFTYGVSDGVSTSPPATVTVTVRPVNDAPVANADSASTATDTAVVVPVLANDSDVDGDTLSVVIDQPPATGTAEVVDGGVRYTPAPGWNGTATFTYRAADASLSSAPATVTVMVNPPATHPLVAELDALCARLGIPPALAAKLHARVEAAVAASAAGRTLGVVREMTAYTGEVTLAQIRRQITKAQAAKLYEFGARATGELMRRR